MSKHKPPGMGTSMWLGILMPAVVLGILTTVITSRVTSSDSASPSDVAYSCDNFAAHARQHGWPLKFENTSSYNANPYLPCNRPESIAWTKFSADALIFAAAAGPLLFLSYKSGLIRWSEE